MNDSEAQPARKEQLDLGAYAFVSSATPAESPYYPSLSGATLSRSTQGKSRMR